MADQFDDEVWVVRFGKVRGEGEYVAPGTVVYVSRPACLLTSKRQYVWSSSRGVGCGPWVPAIEPAPTPPPKPIVRCGQRWKLDGVEVELYDEITITEPGSFMGSKIMVVGGLYVARNWDGVRVNVAADALKERGVFLSGPTEPETHAEAVRRILEIEAANPPEGIGREEWRSMLINRIGDGIRNTGSVRMVADDARAEVAEKWRKFGGGR